MIRAVKADREGFRRVEFEAGFNVVLAERTQESTKKDTRNGLGKTTLLNIIHFCLGQDKQGIDVLKADACQYLTFTVDLRSFDDEISVSRNVRRPGKIKVEADDDWLKRNFKLDHELAIHQPALGLPHWQTNREATADQLARILGSWLYDLQDEDLADLVRYHDLIQYDIRLDSVDNPFKCRSSQYASSIHLSNSYMLDLSWRFVSEGQRLSKLETELSQRQKQLDDSLNDLATHMNSIGELETERSRLQNLVAKTDKELKSFQVHPQYMQIQSEANDLTRQIHDLNNEALQLRRLIDFHRQSMTAEELAQDSRVVDLYDAAKVALAEPIRKRLEDVQQFHHQVTNNRRDFLRSEASRLGRQLADTNLAIEEKSSRRALLMRVLNTHGAIEEFSELRQLNLQQHTDLETIENCLESRKQIETETSELNIEREKLFLDARRDFGEQITIRRAREIFNSNSEALYEAPGSLIVDLDRETGYKFRIDINREGSAGISKMKVFCYDLMRAELWSTREVRPGFLIHDSDIFAGVDERQLALALQLAERKSRECGFQYIVCLNSDQVPRDDFSDDFDFDSFVRLKLTDDTPAGSLLGMRF